MSNAENMLRLKNTELWKNYTYSYMKYEKKIVVGCWSRETAIFSTKQNKVGFEKKWRT